MLGNGAIDNPTAPPIFGILEADTLEIGEFGDRVIGFDGDDVISFAAGEDTTGRDMDVMGGSGDDTITLGLGDDSIEGGLGSGSDEFYGGYGNDILNSAGPAGIRLTRYSAAQVMTPSMQMVAIRLSVVPGLTNSTSTSAIRQQLLWQLTTLIQQPSS